MRAAARPPLPLLPLPATTRTGPSPPTRRTRSARLRPVCSMSARSARAYFPVASIISCCVCAAVMCGSSLQSMVGNVTRFPPDPGSDSDVFAETGRAVNVLNVIKLLESLEEADDFLTVVPVQFNRGLRKFCQLAHGRFRALLLQAFQHAVKFRRLGIDGQTVLVHLKIKRTELDGELLQFLGRLRNHDYAPRVELPGCGARHVPAVFGEHVADFGCGPVPVVRECFNHDGDTRRTVTFVYDLVVIIAFRAADGPLDGAVNHVTGNVVGFGC